MDRRYTINIGILAMVFVLIPLVASAGLLGSTVTGTPLFPDVNTLGGTGHAAGPILIDNTVEFPDGLILYSGYIDITDRQIVWMPTLSTTYLTSSFNGFSLEFFGAPTITNVALNAGSLMSATGISFTGSKVFIDFSGQTAVAGQAAVFDVNPVPEPATLLLLGLAMAGLAGAKRSRK